MAAGFTPQFDVQGSLLWRVEYPESVVTHTGPRFEPEAGVWKEDWHCWEFKGVAGESRRGLFWRVPMSFKGYCGKALEGTDTQSGAFAVQLWKGANLHAEALVYELDWAYIMEALMAGMPCERATEELWEIGRLVKGDRTKDQLAKGQELGACALDSLYTECRVRRGWSRPGVEYLAVSNSTYHRFVPEGERGWINPEHAGNVLECAGTRAMLTGRLGILRAIITTVMAFEQADMDEESRAVRGPPPVEYARGAPLVEFLPGAASASGGPPPGQETAQRRAVPELARPAASTVESVQTAQGRAVPEVSRPAAPAAEPEQQARGVRIRPKPSGSAPAATSAAVGPNPPARALPSEQSQPGLAPWVRERPVEAEPPPWRRVQTGRRESVRTSVSKLESDRLDSVSRKLVAALRHGKFLQVDEGGWAALDVVLATRELRRLGADETDVFAVMAAATKQRLEVQRRATADGHGRLYIRAMQGHSRAKLDDALLFGPRAAFTHEHPQYQRYLYHGTFEALWERIVEEGLKAGGDAGASHRTHIHFALRIRDDGETPGVRSGTDVLIAVDADRYLRDGGKLWVTASQAVLTRGLEGTHTVPARYIASVKHRISNEILWTAWVARF